MLLDLMNELPVRGIVISNFENGSEKLLLECKNEKYADIVISDFLPEVTSEVMYCKSCLR